MGSEYLVKGSEHLVGSGLSEYLVGRECPFALLYITAFHFLCSSLEASY